MPTTGGGSVERTNAYSINIEGITSQSIPILSVNYNNQLKNVLVTIDTSDSDWVIDTWYEITIKPSVHNKCGTPQGISVSTKFKTGSSDKNPKEFNMNNEKNLQKTIHKSCYRESIEASFGI
jgi:hypothetical protein